MEKEHYEQLEKRVQQLEKEVQLLKQRLGSKSEILLESKTVSEPKLPYENRKKETLHEETIPMSPSPVKEKEPVDWENLIGRVWLPRIFVFVLLLGLIWGFKVAVDYGVLTEPIRVALGFGVAFGLYFLGEKQIKGARQSLGKSLLVGAIGILILTTFAMNVLYGMAPTIVAFGLNMIWVGIGLFLANRHHSQVMAILMAFIGYLIPFLVAGSGNVHAAVIYEIVFYATLVSYAIYKEFKGLFYVATSLLHVVYIIFMIGTLMNYDNNLVNLMAMGAVIQHVIIFYSVYQAKFNKMFPVPLLFTSFIVTTFWVKVGTLHNEYQYVIYLIVVSIGYGLVVYLNKNKLRKDLISVALSITTFGVFLLLLQAFSDDGNVLIASFLFEGVIAIYLGCRFQVVFQKLSGALVYIAGTLMIMFTYIYEIVSLETFIWIFFIISLYFLIYLAKIYYEKNEVVQVAITFGTILGHLLFFIRLPKYGAVFSLELLAMLVTVFSLFMVYVWTKGSYATNKAVKTIVIGINAFIQLVVLTDLVRFNTNDFSYNITMMSISFSWALYAAICVIAGVFYNKKIIRLLGIGLLILTLAKLLLVDLIYVTIVVRAILFIGLGAIGMLLSRLLYVKKK
ncbi:DUF2339 domain-containing protein [Metabacillus rhizolycopersici]|uniref:DUF2339 domain-containing protein n=1 Tax=Metabacillus rhizolycopersici TaxID=2875709 RepID=A0ABS7UVP8_9BACI|nr:DUF2339 domain-containing protein [Metabacillus rhizolycopersici]MBZ5752058.1 DUF2339 domain-containing protein [Metabacillus rhizolycopersici]